MKLPPLSDHGQLLPRSEDSITQNAARYGTAVMHKITRTLVTRSSSTCEPGNDAPVCQKPTDSTNTQTLPIVLGAVIPITCAIVVFIYLHRRNKKKQAIEDANDPHKSLDFGVGHDDGQGRKKKRGFGRNQSPEMKVPELSHDPMRPAYGKQRGGLSMDMLGSPYLLPTAGVNGSGESLHGMQRIHDEHDPYRPVTMMRESSEASRNPRANNETGSVYSASTFQTGTDKSNLLSNAQSMSTSYPSRGESIFQVDSKSQDEFATREMHSAYRSTSASRKASLSSSTSGLANISESNTQNRNSRQESLPPLPPAREAETFEQHVPPPRTTSISLARPPRKSSAGQKTLPVISRASDASFYGDDEPPPPPPPKVMEPEDWSNRSLAQEPAVMYSGRFSIDTPAPSQQYPVPTQENRLSTVQPNNRLSVMGMRPLPPDVPEDNPEQRANRIRSFYKEYFDDSRPHPVGGFYEEEFDPAYAETGVYDPETGEYIYPNAFPQAPFAQPMGRRAMTPPPGGFRGMPSPGGDHNRHYSSMSGGRATIGGRPAPRQPPKKKAPPPKALMSLPTPHMLKGDEAFYTASEFAPPTSFRELQNGRRPDSPMGIQRPYSPSVKAYSPLVPAFDDLAPMPSPHMLRKSGTFTSLDFAAPRFRGTEGRDSDAGSIRSARSGISAMQMDAVRAGAYRVSRIPKEFVTSREDLSNQLRPKMNLISPA